MSTENITAKAQILVRRSPEEVFNAFINPDIMSKFWFRRTDQGLKEGETISWYVGDGPDAITIEIRVKSIISPSQIIIQWGDGGQFTTVTWTLEEYSPNITKLMIEEQGYTGSYDEIVSQALDSTCGFNQVIVALKALLEHNAVVNIVNDHV